MASIPFTVDDRWTRELGLLFPGCFRRRTQTRTEITTKKPKETVVVLKTTAGKKMTFGTDQETDIYFKQLQNSWAWASSWRESNTTDRPLATRPNDANEKISRKKCPIFKNYTEFFRNKGKNGKAVKSNGRFLIFTKSFCFCIIWPNQTASSPAAASQPAGWLTGGHFVIFLISWEIKMKWWKMLFLCWIFRKIWQACFSCLSHRYGTMRMEMHRPIWSIRCPVWISSRISGIIPVSCRHRKRISCITGILQIIS